MRLDVVRHTAGEGHADEIVAAELIGDVGGIVGEVALGTLRRVEAGEQQRSDHRKQYGGARIDRKAKNKPRGAVRIG